MNESIAIDVIDTHIHSRQKPTGIKKYDFDATHVFEDLANGGVILAHEMPNTTPPLTTHKEIKSRIKELHSIKNYGGLYFCYNGKNLEELKKCLADPEVHAYIVGVKIYPATPSGSVTTSGGEEQDMYNFSLEGGSELDQVARFCVEQNLSITIHCEDPVEKAKIGKEYGTFDDETEPLFVANVVLPLCEKYPALKFIIAHISHKRTSELVREAWDAGLKNLFIEMTPHHTLLSTTEIREALGKDEIFGFCHPFVKISGGHRGALGMMLENGEYQDQIIYGSDHAPHSMPAKSDKKFGGIPNHQGAQIMLAWFRARGFQMNDPIVQKFFSGNAQRIFQGVPEWTERFKQRTGSILFTPAEYQEGISIPNRIHKNFVANPWGQFLRDELKEHWVVPKAA